MISHHPRLKAKNKDFLLTIEQKQFGLTGDIYKPVMGLLYDIFSWVYIDGKFDIEQLDNKAIQSVLSKYDLETYKGTSISYSAVLLYADLSRKFNMRALGQGREVPVEQSSNKLFSKDHFLFDELYDLYNNSKGDLSTDFLLFNELFDSQTEKEVLPIRSPGDVVRVVSKTAMVRPDFEYKLMTKQLLTNYSKETSDGNEDKFIYVLQDCTRSTKQYEAQINMIKGFILNEAFKYGYIVDWLFVESGEIDSQRFSKETIKQTKIKNVVFGSKVNMTKLLTEDRFLGKQVIIITDGTDPFNFKFNTKTKKINVVSLTDNKNIKNKISNYGRFFKVFAT